MKKEYVKPIIIPQSDYAEGVWEGDASSVTFSLTKPDGAKTTNLPISGIKVTYKRGSVAPHAVLRNIEIATMPDKLAYNEGEFFDPTGLVIEVTYNDKSTTYRGLHLFVIDKNKQKLI